MTAFDDALTVASDKPRKDALIEAASHLFRSKGYERTSVRDLAQAVGIQSGSLFYHFRSKSEILEAVMAHGIGEITRNARSALHGIQGAKPRLLTLLRVHLTALLGSQQHALEVSLYEWDSLDLQARQLIVSLRDEYELIWQQVLDDAVRSGLISQDTKLLRKMLLGSLNWTVQWFQPSGDLSIDQLAERMLALLIREPLIPSCAR